MQEEQQKDLKELNEDCDIQSKISMGRKRMSILKDGGQPSNLIQIGNARKSIIKMNGILIFASFNYFLDFGNKLENETLSKERTLFDKGQNKQSNVSQKIIIF